MRDPAYGMFIYSYDTANNLAMVTAPGQSSRTQRKYVYENLQFANALTGIIDENGKRFTTWNYDPQGRAFSSEHANGIDKFTIVFDQSGSSRVTDPLLTDRTLNFTPVFGIAKYSGESQRWGSGCEAASRYVTFDDMGNVKTRTDFNGGLTTYGYDGARKLETIRIEAVARPSPEQSEPVGIRRWQSSWRYQNQS
ncbi:hypothetical protein LP419_29415 [Massilia sp. H-1]|nr:hypothetical protein LP419_29415 [Massilia sp. H-1]